jgi:membrane-associated phospholipid phosphatase
LDPVAYRALVDPPWESGAPWVEMFQAAGYFPTWLLVAAAMLLIDLRWQSGLPVGLASRRALILLWPGVLAGVIAAVLKILVRRERPWYTGGKYEFRGITDEGFFHGGGLGMPSSHAAVAFAGLFVLARLYPKASPVWLVIGAGCALSRLDRGVHFFSDVYAGAVLGCLCGLLAWRAHTRRRPSEEPVGAE